MSHKKSSAGFILGAAIAGVAIVLLGCSSQNASPTTQASAEATPAPAIGGAERWAQVCGQCHYIRSPSEYNAAQWQVIVHHMRLRAGLTGDEQKQITEFLQSASH